MTAKLINGIAVARAVEEEIRAELRELEARGIQPTLIVLRVGNDAASEVYVRNKARKAKELGFNGIERHLPETIGQESLRAEIEALNGDPDVDGILLQMPLPSHLDSKLLLEAIDPRKDVDGFHPVNVGKLHLGRPALTPCTPAGIIRLIESTGTEIAGKHAVVIGRSDIVGKPMAALLLQRNATVTICHSRTGNLEYIVRQGELVIAAVGRPGLVTEPMIRKDAVVIDVGMNRLTRTPAAEQLLRLDPIKLEVLRSKGSVLVGDVDFAAVRTVASWITPVPGGVGPMTIVMLMKNTISAAKERRP